MTTVLTALILGAVIALMLTRLAIAIAWRYGFVDRPDGFRKIHTAAVPRFGGPAVLIAFWVPVLAVRAFPELTQMARVLVWDRWDFWGLVGGSVAALALGLADDFYDVRPRYRLILQVLIATGMYACGFRIANISNPLGGGLPLGIFAYPVTVFWFLGCMNAVNLLDGIDGLAAGTVFFVAMTLLGLSLQFQNLLGMLMMASLGGAILGFLWYNFPPARIFLGNSGSTLLGFLVAGLSLIASKKAEAAVALFVPVIAMGLPILDTSLAIVRRWYRRMPLSAPDREHVHHVLVSMGFSHRRAVLVLYGICVVFGVAAMIVAVERNEGVLLVIGILVVVAYASIRIFGGVPVREAVRKMLADDNRRRSLAEVKVVCARTVTRLDTTDSAAGLWEVCGDFFRTVGVNEARLVFDDSAREPLHWADAGRPPDTSGDPGAEWQPADEITLCLSLEVDRRRLGTLELEKRGGGTPICMEAPSVLHTFRRGLSEALLRLSHGPADPRHP